MCFTIDQCERKPESLFGNKDVIVCYKAVRIIPWGNTSRYPDLITIYRGEPVRLGTTQVSNRASAKVTKSESTRQRIDRGIHVYLNATQAKNELLGSEAVVRVFCKKEDYVAHNSTDAVFTKVKYDNKFLYKNIVKQSPKDYPDESYT